MSLSKLAATILAATGVAALAPATASALSCRPIERPEGPLLDAIALSGPTVPMGGNLLSPARFLVVRSRDGDAPRVVRVTTGVGPRDGRGRVPVIAGQFVPSAGDTYRIAGRPGRGGAWRNGGILTTSICFGTRPISDPPSLRHVDRTVVVETVGPAVLGAGDRSAARWRARLLRGPHGLRCIGMRRIDAFKRTIARGCELVPSRRPIVVATAVRGTADVASTVVAVSGPGLDKAAVSTPGETRIVPARRHGRIAITVYDGVVDAADIDIVPSFDGAYPKPASARSSFRRKSSGSMLG